MKSEQPRTTAGQFDVTNNPKEVVDVKTDEKTKKTKDIVTKK